MSKKAETKMPEVELATKDWVEKQMIDAEKRIEKAFHDQTQYLTASLERMNNQFSSKHDAQTRWIVGLIIAMTVAILSAVLFQ